MRQINPWFSFIMLRWPRLSNCKSDWMLFTLKVWKMPTIQQTNGKLFGKVKKVISQLHQIGKPGVWDQWPLVPDLSMYHNILYRVYMGDWEKFWSKLHYINLLLAVITRWKTAYSVILMRELWTQSEANKISVKKNNNNQKKPVALGVIMWYGQQSSITIS